MYSFITCFFNSGISLNVICDSCDCDFMECQVKAECMLKCFAKSTGATVLVNL